MATMSSSSNTSPHILVFPYPAQGHMIPLLDLTHQLSLRNLTITILVTPKNLPILNPLLSNHPSIQTLVLPFPSHPKIPSGVENIKDLGVAANVFVISALAKLRDPIVDWFRSHPNPPVAILSDFFLGWTVQLATDLHIRRFGFFSSGAFLTSVIEYCWRNYEKIRSKSVVELTDLPRSPSFVEGNLPSVFRFYVDSDPDWNFVRDGLIANVSSFGCVFNTFEALEKEYLDYMENRMIASNGGGGGGRGSVYGVGPISLLGQETTERGNWSLDSNTDVVKWLDGCPDGSVIYVCFGSQKLMNSEQMEALATGLEQSRTRFVWVVKPGTNGFGCIPDGFEDRVSGMGIVVKGWAPQMTILSHPAVGGFLSHCGWNSVQEAIVAGVMILAWPMEADQFVNGRLLVEDMGAAVKVCEGSTAVPNPTKLAQVITESMTGATPEKVKAKQLREEAAAAVKFGGSSAKDLDRLVRDLGQL